MDGIREDASATDGTTSPSAAKRIALTTPVRYSIYLIALVLIAASLYFARAFFIPVTLAVLLALVLSPIVRAGRHQGFPHVFSSAVLVTLVAVGLIAGLLMIGAPAAQWIDETPQLGEQIEQRLKGLREPVEAVSRASEQVEEATKTGPPVTEVVVKDRSLLSRAADNLLVVLTTIGLTLLLTFFILSSSDIFYAKLIALSPTLSEKKSALGLVRNIERVVSRYLFTVTVINCGLGVAIGLAMWAIGLPNPYLWGVAAVLLNFMPYVGMFLGAVLVAAVALVSFDQVGYALLTPVVYLTLTSIEGGLVTPVILGRRLALNTVAIFLAIGFWGWLWGVVGLLIAVPLLVITKVICDHVEALAPFGEFLSASREVGVTSLAPERLQETSSAS